MTTALATIATSLAHKLGMGDHSGVELVAALKATAFKGQVTDAQLTALLVVAQQYGLNPWTKEIYAFPDKGGIVPIVGVDGWSRIINSHPQFDGMEFLQDDESCTCIIYRKDRGHPIKVTEWMAECKRSGQGPWSSHPKRMLRHKAMIQGARLAFGYAGIFDQDEAERILEAPGQADEVADASGIDRRALVDRAEAAALLGWRSYAEFCKALTKSERDLIGVPTHNELKAIAKESDAARTVDAEEVPA